MRGVVSLDRAECDSQSNESAIEQLKDEEISDAIRMAFRSATGAELGKDK